MGTRTHTRTAIQIAVTPHQQERMRQISERSPDGVVFLRQGIDYVLMASSDWRIAARVYGDGSMRGANGETVSHVDFRT